MLKIILMTALLFLGMLGYDTFKEDSGEAPPPPKKQEQRISQHEISAIKALFLKILPPKEQWPLPVQKFYLIFNLDETVNPIREKPDWTSLSAMSNDMPKALIAIEDHDFYKHGPVDINGIARALLVNATAGEILQGGSTITQQLVKNIFLTHEQNWERKVEEIILAAAIEQRYSKDEVLELYLNTTYFGAGASGVKQTARRLFDKAPSALTLAECAVIAALPYAPSALNPLENPDGCRKRQLLVLNAMQKYGFITQGQYNEAKSERVLLSNGSYLHEDS